MRKMRYSIICFFIMMIFFIFMISYESMYKRIEERNGSGLEKVAQMSTLLLTRGEDHNKILEHYLQRNKDITLTPEFKRVQKTLKDIRKKNHLNSNIHILIRQKWAPRHMISLITDNDKNYVTALFPLDPLAKEVYKQGVSKVTPIYKNEKGSWISAFAHIPFSSTEGKEGNVDGILKIDYNVDAELEAAKNRMIKHLMLPSLLLILISIGLGSFMGLPSAILDSLGQAILVFDKRGRCHPYSKACLDLLETSPKSRFIWNVLKGDEKSMRDWKDALFKEAIPFDDLKAIGPQTFLHSKKDRSITIDYHPVRNGQGKLEKVVVVATDKTEKRQQQEKAERQQSVAAMILKVVQNKQQFKGFLQEVTNYITEMRNKLKEFNEDSEGDVLDVNLLLRYVHTIKGGAGIYYLKKLQNQAHIYEKELATLKSKGGDSYSRIIACQVKLEHEFNDALNQTGMIIGRNSLGKKTFEIPLEKLEDFQKKIYDPGLQKAFIDSFLTEPILDSFQAYDELVKDIAERQNKQLKPITFIRGNLEIQTKSYQPLFSTLIHAFRNAVDHGIESPHVRKQRGKDPQGQITVTFDRVRGQGPGRPHRKDLKIVIQDDGHGIAPDHIRKKLASLGRQQEAENPNEEGIIQYIFESGFTTNTHVNEISGRGVGMDVIASEVKKLCGKIHVKSTSGKGTTLTIQVPYLFDLEEEKLKLSKAS